jgi:hypothetical protein
VFVLLEFEFHVGYFFVFVHGLFVDFIGGFLVLLQFGLLD